MTDLFTRYEQGGDAIARLAKELDKYQAIDLALEYEETQQIPLFEEFLNYYKRDWPFAHPVVLQWIEALQARHQKNS